MNYIDLFSGIGGFALGAYWAGMKFDRHYFSEVDPYCVELYQKRFPDAIPLGDITKHEEWDIADGEYIITGGFPCQPFSEAGKRRQEADARNLWPGMRGVIRSVRPVWVVAENVQGAAEYIKRVVKPELEAESFDVWPFSISARALGAWQVRKRLFIMAHSTSNRRHRPARSVQYRATHEKLQTAACRPSWGWSSKQRGSLSGRLRPFPDPGVFKVADGLSRKMELAGFGNAIVPQIAQLLFEQIRRCEEE